MTASRYGMIVQRAGFVPAETRPANKGGRPPNARLAAIDDDAVAWLAADPTRKARDAAKQFLPDYRPEHGELDWEQGNRVLTDLTKRIRMKVKRAIR